MVDKEKLNNRFIVNNISKKHILVLNFGILIFICLISLLVVEIPIIFLWSILVFSFIVFFSKELATSESFIIFYYFILVISYFLVGYFGIYSFNQSPYVTIFYSRILVGMFHFLPFFIVFGLSIYSKHFRKILLYKYFVIVLLLIYILVINIFIHPNLDMSLIIQIRNFLAPFVAFLWGSYASDKIRLDLFYKSLLFIALIITFFGFFEYWLNYNFWLNFFPCYFVALIKKAGTLDNGLIGNKIIGMGNKVFFRMSSFFYEPKFAGYNFVFYFFFLIALIKERLIRFSPKILGAFCLLVLLLCIILTFIKSAWGVFGISIVILSSLKLIGIKKIEKYKFILTWVLLFLGVFGSIGLILVFLKLGISSTTITHVRATLNIFNFSFKELLFGRKLENFNILNSDSGLATIIFSIGFVGYFIFTYGIVKILNNILETDSFSFIKLVFFSLIIAWFAALHFKSDVWSPLGNFIIFFTAGVVSNLRMKSYHYAIYYYSHWNRS